jgi:uncharacterized protein (TIGR02996 family)
MMHSGMLQHPQALWRAISQEPGDDQPRLRYADWLDERCDPLGEFIRVQCRLARRPGDNQLAWELERREQELLAEYEQEWSAPVADLVDWCVFRRGFIAEAGMSAADFVRHAAALSEHACLQQVHVRDAGAALAPFLRAPLLARLRHLDLSNNPVRDAGARLVAECPHLGGLTSLNLSSALIGNVGAQALARAKGFSGLRELYLCDNRIGATGVRALAESPLASQLRVLHVRFNDFGMESRRLLEQVFGRRVLM